ncbi:hypothetical protein [Parasitella parasitica]|uniref:Uncharacterized protein n=1 Tax=Parasitella parasitica TaxID=35722 RepID=A0A0B7NJY8_9FUNG|nr:hypothetical protein [Parasitella parasitica]
MRYLILIGTFVLILATRIQASSIFQSFFSSTQQQLEDEMFVEVSHLLDNLINPQDAVKNCKSCINMLKMIKRFCYLPESIQLAAMTNICKRSKQVDSQVCEGMVREQGPVIRKVLKTMDISGRDGHLACASVLNACPYPGIEPWNVSFPKKKPKHPHVHKPTNKTMTVLHLSDWHVDPLYEEGTETLCDKPICCRRESTDFDNILKLSSPWGSYGCDSPLTLIESMLEYIPTVTPNTSFAILTGDIPPHEVWETLPTKKTQMIQDASYTLLHAHFDSPFFINAKLYPAIGNHESAPTNLFPLADSNLPGGNRHDDLTMGWLYESLQENWKGWLPKKHLDSVHQNSGSYISHPVPGLKLISLNTNFCYNLNWWLYEHPTKRDPNGILKWLISHLQNSEDANERVWIIGHTPPGDSSCFHDYANYYYQIIERYAPHVIAGQFFGHTHRRSLRDEIQIFYKHASQESKDAISVAYLGPSITPFPNLNPGFRTYTVDTGTFEVVDSDTFIAELDKSTAWDQALNWHKEYSAKELYGSTKNPYKPLSASWWHHVTREMELDDEKFDLYWLNRYKSSPMTPNCDQACRVNTICGMRAGKSELRCDYDPSESTPRPVILEAIWNGKIPMKITLDPTDIDIYGNAKVWDPIYLEVSRCSYLPLVTKHLQQLLLSLGMQISEQAFQSIWYDYDLQPLKWHYPVGLLFDLHTVDLCTPWNITLHFKGLPSDSILLNPTPETMQDMFMSMIKEADFLRNGNIKKVMNLSKRDTTQLWDSLSSDRYSEFREVNKHLVEYTDSLRHVPLRIYLPDNCPTVQELVSYHGSEKELIPTLGTILEKVIPDLFESSQLNGKIAIVAHSIVLPLDMPINWAYENLSFADNFLHIVVVKKSVD